MQPRQRPLEQPGKEQASQAGAVALGGGTWCPVLPSCASSTASSKRWMHLCWLVRLFVAIVADTSDLSHLYVVDIQPGTREDKCAVPPVIRRATAHLLFIPCLPQIRAHSPGAGVPLERQWWWGRWLGSALNLRIWGADPNLPAAVPNTPEREFPFCFFFSCTEQQPCGQKFRYFNRLGLFQKKSEVRKCLHFIRKARLTVHYSLSRDLTFIPGTGRDFQ